MIFRRCTSFASVALLSLAVTACGDAEQAPPVSDDSIDASIDDMESGDLRDEEDPDEDVPVNADPADDERPAEDERPADDEPPADDPPAVNDVCGDGAVTGAEPCDGADLAGAGCLDVGFASGTLGCSNTCDSFRTSGCAALPVTPIAALGAQVQVDGTFEQTDGRWTRPSADCAQGTGNAYFEAHAFVNNTGASQRIIASASWGEGNDGYLHLFSGGANVRELDGCLTGNDDGADMTLSAVDGFDLPVGATIVVVASTYAPDTTFGPWSLIVATVDPAAVPPVVDPADPADPADPTDPTDPVVEPDLCGNGVIDDGEACDGAALGDQTCQAAGFSDGFLTCASTCSTVVNNCFNPADNLVPIAFPGAHIDLDGNLTVLDGSFTRPGEDCAAGALQSNYEVIRIVNDTGAAQLLDLAATFTEGGDGVLHVYGESFDPNAPTAGCLVGNDDAGDLSSSALTAVPIAVDQVLTVVVSSFSAPAGAYALDVTTVAVPTPVPNISVGAIGTSVQLSGDLKEAAVWDRVGQDCDVTASGGQRFLAHRVVNETGGHQHISLSATWDGDGFLAVFSEDFLAGSPSASCIAADDDHSDNLLPGSGVFGSALSDLRIESGEAFIVVASSFSAMSSVGGFTIDVQTDSHDGPTVLELPTDLGTKATSGTIHVNSPQLFDGVSTYFYDATLVQNHGNHEHGIELNAAWADGEDGRLDVYLLDPDAPGGLGLLIATNDDFEGIGNSRLSGDELRVFGDEIIVVVATTFFADDAIGSYGLTVTTTD